MDSGTPGIAVISTKSLDSNPPPPATTNNSSQMYVNQAFEDGADEGSKTAGGTSVANDSSTTSTKAGQSNLYDDIHHTKKGHHHSSVDFTMPEKRRESRSKSFCDEPYRGMGKDELLRFSSRPLWRNLRYVCMSIVLVGWLALLITVVALVLTYPPCKSRESQSTEWWQKSVIYRVYVRGFHDGNGMDGVGDIKGLRNRLDYIKSTGADTISLSPIYKLASDSKSDTDIVDHKDIDPVFGTLDEFRLLVNETHSKGMTIILDFIPNHTSDKHPWFQGSSVDPGDRRNRFGSYYVWEEYQGTSAEPVNNWKSVYGCPAWTNLQTTDFYYLHQFSNTQPDLNLRSDRVRDELEDILKFWLGLGVDGFYIRDSDFLFEDFDLRDEELIDNTTVRSQFCGSANHHPYSSLNHEFTKGLDQNMDMFARWRALLDDFGNKTQKYKLLIADVTGPIHHVMDYYGLFSRDGVDFPLNPFSHEFNASEGGAAVSGMVSDWMNNMPNGRWANWMSGDDRTPRLADRMSDKLVKVYMMLMMLLPGTPFLYYGDEIGMHSSTLAADVPMFDRRKPMRGPMMWNNKTFYGFCDPHCQTAPEVDFGPNQFTVESHQNNPESLWHLIKNLTELRRDNPSFEYGDFNTALVDEDVYSFVREFDGEKGYLVALNFGPEVTTSKYTGTHSTIPGSATVELVSGSDSGHSRGSSVSLGKLELAAGEGVVVSWEYEGKEL